MLMSDSPSIAAYSVSAASHLPMMIARSLIGEVIKSSIVPLRFSSANRRMVIIGIKNNPMTLTLPSSGRTTESFTLIGWLCPIMELCTLARTK